MSFFIKNDRITVILYKRMSFPVIIISSYHGCKRMTVIRVDNASRRQSNIFPKGQLFWEAEAIVGRLHKVI